PRRCRWKWPRHVELRQTGPSSPRKRGPSIPERRRFSRRCCGVLDARFRGHDDRVSVQPHRSLVTFLQILLLALARFAAGMVNAVAGGGSFFTFAALVFSGLPTLDANATSAVALTPSNMAIVAGYRPEVRKYFREMLPFLVLGTVGAALGAWLLIVI